MGERPVTGSNAASPGPMPGLTTTDEDPGIWRDERGHFHAIFHGPGHAWSANGVDWSYNCGVRSLCQGAGWGVGDGGRSGAGEVGTGGIVGGVALDNW